MIPNRWYALTEASDLGAKPLPLKRLGLPLVLWRDTAGAPHALVDRCPHRGVALSSGKVCGDHLACPYHGFRFDGAGACRHLPFQGAADAEDSEKAQHIPKGLEATAFDLQEAYGFIWLWWGAPDAPHGEIPWIPDMPAWDHPAWAKENQPWPQHYVRCVESNFDGYHAATLHGRWMPTLTGEIAKTTVVEQGEGLYSEQHLVQSKGRDPIVFKVWFQPPNLTAIAMGESAMGIVLDCPIDDENTWRMTRFIQTAVNIPGVRWLGSWALLKSDWGILQRYEDLPLARTMDPQYPVEGAQKLVGPDAGMARYRAWRRRALRALDPLALPPHVAEALQTSLVRGHIRPKDAPREDALAFPAPHSAA